MATKGLDVKEALSSKKEEKREAWSQTKRVGDLTEEIRVEKLDNTGYLVCISKSWYDKKGDWKNKESKLYSEKNPLDEDESDNPVEVLFDLLGRK